MKHFMILLAAFTACLRLNAQGSFQNLSFEETLITPGTPPGLVTTSQAIPGWNAFLDDTPLSEIWYNGGPLFTSSVSLRGPSSGIDGSYLMSLVSIGTGDSSISQTAVLPAQARYLLLKTSLPGPGFSLSVSINDEIIAYQPLESTDYALYSADISRFAGTSGTLAFTAVRGSVGVGSFLLDSIEFSAIPEPRATVFLVLAAGILLLFHSHPTAYKKRLD